VRLRYTVNSVSFPSRFFLCRNFCTHHHCVTAPCRYVQHVSNASDIMKRLTCLGSLMEYTHELTCNEATSPLSHTVIRLGIQFASRSRKSMPPRRLRSNALILPSISTSVCRLLHPSDLILTRSQPHSFSPSMRFAGSRAPVFARVSRAGAQTLAPRLHPQWLPVVPLQ
jgi:hypothetical protein